MSKKDLKDNLGTIARSGTKNFLVLGKYERSLDKLIISIQLIDIASWDEVDSRRITGYYNKIDDVNSSLVALAKTMLSPYLPKPTESKYPTLTEGKGMQEPPTYAQSALDVSSAIDQAIVDLEKKLDVSIGAQGQIDPDESQEIEGEWVLDFSKEDYENAKPENEKSLPGGNGIAFDWKILKGFETKKPKNQIPNQKISLINQLSLIGMENLHWVGTIFKPINNYPRHCLLYTSPSPRDRG